MCEYQILSALEEMANRSIADVGVGVRLGRNELCVGIFTELLIQERS